MTTKETTSPASLRRHWNKRWKWVFGLILARQAYWVVGTYLNVVGLVHEGVNTLVELGLYVTVIALMALPLRGVTNNQTKLFTARGFLAGFFQTAFFGPLLLYFSLHRKYRSKLVEAGDDTPPSPLNKWIVAVLVLAALQLVSAIFSIMIYSAL